MRTRTKRPEGSPTRRGGFTLIELLVVITIIGMLMALVFPAVGAVLETVKLNQCANTLRSIGQGISNYQAQRGNKWPVVSTKQVDCRPAEVPARRKGTQTKVAPEAGYSWMVKLLPFIGSQTIYNDIQSASQTFRTPAFDLGVGQLTDAGTKRHASTLNPPKIFQCASYEGNMASEAPEYAQYAGDFGV